MSVVIETSIGDLVIDLYTDERPNCCKNFLKLCKIKYYHYCLFHEVQKNYIAQTGDPTGTGRGGESIFSFVYGDQAKYIEMEKLPKIKHRKLGAVSMINNGQNMHGSQFFITLNSNLDYLDDKHTVFGEVAKGFDVLEKLNETICDKQGRPYQDIRIFHTVILDDPFEDFAQLSVENGRESPLPTNERLESDRIRVDEEVDQLEGLTQDEIDALMKEREAKTRAQLLEIIGDLPDADMKPPENVLFVCKLNSVTSDEDLELIFSRFGKINSCEVIRDRKTGDSLCYAFIEFDRQEDCESAYFKMDNVLIDDRRIHVDFSQSVAKVNWKGKGTGTGYFADNRHFNSNKKNSLKFSNDEKDDDKEKFRIHDKSKRNGNASSYDLVFDEEPDDDSVIKKNSYGREYERIKHKSNYNQYQKQDHKYNEESYNHRTSHSNRESSSRSQRNYQRDEGDEYEKRHDSANRNRNHRHDDNYHNEKRYRSSKEQKENSDSDDQRSRDRKEEKNRSNHHHRHHHHGSHHDKNENSSRRDHSSRDERHRHEHTRRH